VVLTSHALLYRYCTAYNCAPWLLKIWVPFVMGSVIVMVAGMEMRMWYGFTFEDQRGE
jgi:hypothetical protein